MFPTTIHTTECIKPQEAAKNTASADGFKWSDITCVADRKSNLLQYHENTRVTTGAETVTKHLATHVSIISPFRTAAAPRLRIHGFSHLLTICFPPPICHPSIPTRQLPTWVLLHFRQQLDGLEVERSGDGESQSISNSLMETCNQCITHKSLPSSLCFSAGPVRSPPSP